MSPRANSSGCSVPNGAGKTTLLRAVLALVPIQSGSVAVDEREGADAIRLVCGYVPQRHDVAWSFPISVHDAVLNGRVRRMGWLRRPGKADFAAARTALRRVRMDHLADRPIGELSGGGAAPARADRSCPGQRAVCAAARRALHRPRHADPRGPHRTLRAPGRGGRGAADVDARPGRGGRRLRPPGAAAGAGDRRRPPDLLREADAWSRTPQVGLDSPLLAGLGLRTLQESPC